MPNIWTHIDFAEEAIRGLGWQPENDLEWAYLRLGAQGPDPFFYYRFWPWIKEKPAVEVGKRIHDEACGPFLQDLIRTVKEQPENSILKAYVIGFVTHHILDRNAHPYINYRSGNEGRKHQELEFAIDTIWMEERRGVITWKTPVYKQIDVGSRLHPSVAEAMETIIAKHFPKLSKKIPPGYVNEAYRDMEKAQKVLFKFAGRKSRWLAPEISALVYKPVDPNIDYLNRKKSEWLDPTDCTLKYRKSFDDLFADAINEANAILPEIMRYWETESHEAWLNIERKLGNKSYSTGKDCDLGLVNQFFAPIL
ncbi:zinc dependent phospholipase C family protein [Tuberibacillus calidus]|uniref:zinc dependent phospholipase C family protein n=1 Tax=Tuberibacillus calidus TaxID=340097 RepID=UPI0004061DE1|nr:zinc dependent phospholipase C family protein [Tuberibacillus calidus]